MRCLHLTAQLKDLRPGWTRCPRCGEPIWISYEGGIDEGVIVINVRMPVYIPPDLTVSVRLSE